jgi:hypothetical protein
MGWFVPSLEGIAGLIQQQLDACAEIGLRVQVRFCEWKSAG